MQAATNLGITLVVGLTGGLVFSRLKFPGGALIGAMLAVVALRSFQDSGVEIPSIFKFTVQILIGVMIGCTFKPEMLDHIAKLALPVASSTLILVTGGLVLTTLLHKFGLMDTPTAYLATSPGAMTAMLGLAADTKADLPIVLAFHFFRVFFVILTAPIFLQLLKWLLNR